jgi:hypothetical protein
VEVGRRFGNQVGDEISRAAVDVRGDNTAQGFSCANVNATGGWKGTVLAYVNGKRAGDFGEDPFFLPTQAGARVFLEFFLAGPQNRGEDVARYLRSIPGDRVEIDFTRRTTDQSAFRIYYTHGLTNAPSVLLREMALDEHSTGTLTAAVFHYVSSALAKGGHSFQIRPIDAAGNEKTGCAILTAVLAPWPLPPTGVEVHAYSAHTGLVTLKWSKPSDDVTGDRYRIFRSSHSGARVAYGTCVGSATSPVAVVSTAAGAKSYATCSLGVTGPAASGLWLLGVRHKVGSIQEDNFSALARFVVSDKGKASGSGYPFAPSYVTVQSKAGGRLVLWLKHDNAGEPNATLRFKIYRSAGFSSFYDPAFYATAFFPPAGSLVDFSTAVGMITRAGGRFFEGTIGFTGLTDGLLYRFGVRSEATAGLREVNTASYTGIADATPPTSCPNSMSIRKVLA